MDTHNTYNEELKRKYVPPHLRRQYNANTPPVLSANSTHVHHSSENNYHDSTNNPVCFANDEKPLKIQGKDIPCPITDFRNINLPPVLVRNVEEGKYDLHKPHQTYIFSAILNRRDLLSNAKTGSGKTIAHLVPIIANLMLGKRQISGRYSAPRALIITPVRELTISMQYVASGMTKDTDVRCVAIYGGVNPRIQMEQLRNGCDLLFATPGRLLDMVERRVITLSQVQCLLVEELDRLLDMGFEEQLEQLLSKSDMPEPGIRNTVFFSASLSSNTQMFVAKHLCDYILIQTETPKKVIRQKINYCTVENKREVLLKQIDINERTLVFVSTKKAVAYVHTFLVQLGVKACMLHGDLTQWEREESLRNINDSVLVATNLFCRGLMIRDVDHVIIYDIPASIDDYLFQIGRMSATGHSTAFFTSENNDIAKDLIQILKESNQEVPEFLYRSLASVIEVGKKHRRPFGK
jgi:ATP-dependent RNA helicase DDX3X